VVRHPDLHQIMAFERGDSPGSWQLPQGGLEAGEEPLDGAWRELAEETGLGPDEVVVRAEFPDWIPCEWPAEVKAESGRDGKRRGQVHKWFLFDALSSDIVPRPDGREFVAWKWVTPQWLVDSVLEWRRDAYQRVLGSL